MNNLMGSQSVLSTVAFPVHITFIRFLSCMYFHMSPELPRFQKAATRMHYSSTYPLYGPPDGFSKCPFYHSIFHKHHIYKYGPVCISSCLCSYQDFRTQPLGCIIPVHILYMDNLVGSQSVLSTIAISKNITFKWSCMYFLSVATRDKNSTSPLVITSEI